jgi:catechol 2,3-dioxygenase-like lactoylglutathione lyase family enzyme
MSAPPAFAFLAAAAERTPAHYSRSHRGWQILARLGHAVARRPPAVPVCWRDGPSRPGSNEGRNGMAEGHVEAAREPILKLKFLSHGTLEAFNLDESRKFYEEFLGLEVVRTSQVSLMIRLGNTNTIAVVKNERKQAMPILNHNGLDVSTREEVDKCHEIVMAQKDKWGIKKVTRPVDQHGTRSFYLLDLDDNWWEILCNPEGGYSWMFAKGRDIEDWGAEDGGSHPNKFTRKRSLHPPAG